MFSTPAKINHAIQASFKLSANAFNLEKSEFLSFGKEFNYLAEQGVIYEMTVSISNIDTVKLCYRNLRQKETKIFKYFHD